jgi:predicted nucleotidyltransferase
MKAVDEYIRLLTEFKRKRGEEYGIRRMGIFGSVARGEQTESSDIDVFYESNTMSLLDAVGFWQELEELFGRPVDAVSVHERLNPLFKQCIEKG